MIYFIGVFALAMFVTLAICAANVAASRGLNIPFNITAWLQRQKISAGGEQVQIASACEPVAPVSPVNDHGTRVGGQPRAIPSVENPIRWNAGEDNGLPADSIPNTESLHSGTSPAEASARGLRRGVSEATPEGPGTDGHKPLMRNRVGDDCPSAKGYSAGENFKPKPTWAELNPHPRGRWSSRNATN